mmetsp:Transcript_128370/g.363264  ORF Transcript_128370/g.363264 Transcript_128370/m.363264 type:complete len:264 (-) Transcript_128370:311-1102(-)
MPPSSARKMFAGLMSRWRRPCAWSCATASTHCLKMSSPRFTHSLRASGLISPEVNAALRRSIHSRSVPPRTSSICTYNVARSLVDVARDRGATCTPCRPSLGKATCSGAELSRCELVLLPAEASNTTPLLEGPSESSLSSYHALAPPGPGISAAGSASCRPPSGAGGSPAPPPTSTQAVWYRTTFGWLTAAQAWASRRAGWSRGSSPWPTWNGTTFTAYSCRSTRLRTCQTSPKAPRPRRPRRSNSWSKREPGGGVANAGPWG